MSKMNTIKKLMLAAVVAMVGLCGTAWAAAQQKVPYQNWNPTLKQMMPGFCETYKVVRADMTELNSGWYVVSGQVVIDRSKDAEPYKPGLKVNGDVHLILMDGAELVVTGATDCAGIEVGVVDSVTNSLTIYGQQGQTGKLTATGNAGAGIGSGMFLDVGSGNGGDVTINGGEVIAISYPIDNGEAIYRSDGIGVGCNMGSAKQLNPGTLDLSGYAGTHYIYAGMDTNGDEVTDVTNEDFANWHGYCYVQITQTPRGGPAAPAAVKIVSAKSARTEGAWSGAAEVVYELSNLKADGRYALAFELAAAGQFGARTNEVETVVDGVYTQELSRTEFFGIESQVQDPAAELTLKLIEKE